MNDPNAPSLTPRPASAGAATDPPTTSGANENGHALITGGIAAVEAILRQPCRVLWWLQQPGSGRLIALMVLVSVVCGACYGAVIGTFSGGTQIWAAPLKVAGGLV